jgi:hypothetical protein
MVATPSAHLSELEVMCVLHAVGMTRHQAHGMHGCKLGHTLAGCWRIHLQARTAVGSHQSLVDGSTPAPDRATRLRLSLMQTTAGKKPCAKSYRPWLRL